MLYEKEGAADEDRLVTGGWTTIGDAGGSELMTCIINSYKLIRIRDKEYKKSIQKSDKQYKLAPTEVDDDCWELPEGVVAFGNTL